MCAVAGGASGMEETVLRDRARAEASGDEAHLIWDAYSWTMTTVQVFVSSS